MILVYFGCNGRVGCFPLFVILVSCGCNGRVGCFSLFVILVSCGCNGGVGFLPLFVILVSCSCLCSVFRPQGTIDWFVIVLFPGHTHQVLLFLMYMYRMFIVIVTPGLHSTSNSHSRATALFSKSSSSWSIHRLIETDFSSLRDRLFRVM